MRRSLLAVVVVLLAFSVSGAQTLIVVEPCTGNEQQDEQGDADCPPTCITCGCCAQAAEPSDLVLADALRIRLAIVALPIPQRPLKNARDILHVPKPPVA